MQIRLLWRICKLSLPILLWMGSSGCANAQQITPDAFTGTWVMKLGERNLFVLKLQGSGATVTGSMERPAKMSDSNNVYANMRGGVRHDPITLANLKNGVLHITVQNADNAKDQDMFAVTEKGDTLSLAWDDVPVGMIVAPRIFLRTSAGAKVATDWEPNRLYTAMDSDTPSSEMKAIYAEDQRIRTGPMTGVPVEAKEAMRTDAERREQTRKLLASGALHTGKDYEEASFVFQHGDSPSDYLLAHTLAMIAVSKGDVTAIWIASATLDRYLEKIGQKQVFGTQYSRDPQHGWTQEPYDRGLVSDALRSQLGVPPQSEQAEQLKAYQTQH